MGRAESPWEHISLGEGSNYVRGHDKNGGTPDEAAIGCDAAIKKRAAGSPNRTRPVLPLRSCWSFRGIPSAAGCVPVVGCQVVGCPAWVDLWTARAWQSSIGWSGHVGWSVDQHPSCSSASIPQARTGDGYSCPVFSSRASWWACNGSWCICGLVIVGLVLGGDAQAGCQDGVTSKAWNGGHCWGAAMDAIVILVAGCSGQPGFVI